MNAHVRCRGRGRLARTARAWACALGMVFCLTPGAALAEGMAPAEEETPAPMPFQLPAATASASIETSGSPSLPLMLLLLSGLAVAGTLSGLFRSLHQRDALHHQPAPSQRW